MVIVFGVKSSNLEEARAWVERATGLLAQARENDALGGDYYAFRGPLNEELALVENRDPYDGEPVFGFPSWGVLLRIQRIAMDSKALHGLENDPQHFQKLETRGV